MTVNDRAVRADVQMARRELYPYSGIETEGLLSPDEQTVIAVVGRKHSGKSKLVRHIAASYPYDQIIIDYHGDDRPWQLDVERTPGMPYFWQINENEVPERWPEWKRPDEDDVAEVPMILYCQPDAGSSDVVGQMDELFKLAWLHTRCMVIVHEWGEQARVHRTPPYTRRVLNQGRNRQISLIMAMHRPRGVETNTFPQADLVAVFQVPIKGDRDLIADGIGWDRDDFSAGVNGLPPYGYLLYDRRLPPPVEGAPDRRLLEYPPLTPDELAEIDPEIKPMKTM